MEYISSKEFIPKLYTDNFMIGSFDVFEDKSKKIIERDIKSIPDFFKKLPTGLRASIVNKKDKSYVGFISVYDMDEENSCTSIVLGLESDLEDENKKDEIIDSYKEFLRDDLGITKVNVILDGKKSRSKSKLITPTKVVLNSDVLKEDKTDSIIGKLEEQGYTIPNLKMPCIIVDGEEEVGLIGLDKLIWANRRANLHVFIDNEREESYIREVVPRVINEYLEYVHNRNLFNVSFAVSDGDVNMLEAVKNSEMNRYASIPFASSYNNLVFTKHLFQSYPEMVKLVEEKEDEPNYRGITNLKGVNKNFTEVIDLENGFVAVSPTVFEENHIDLTKIVRSHINAMQDRKRFTIPLGDDKTMIQEGNGIYGISKLVNNYTYVILDKDMNYVGFTNILREGALNAELEMAIDPKYQRMGIGTSMRQKFYEELFKRGYLSATSAVFDFNEGSNRLNSKLATYSGTRIKAYYINGRLCDMNFYTRLSEETEKYKVKK